ncbi:hypothetical protein Agub_g1304, partial [Astrephomene gubernaculifera]
GTVRVCARAGSFGHGRSVRRGVLILPGLGNNAADYGPLASLLEARGMAVEVAQVSRLDWSRNAAALVDPNWWKGTLQPRPAVNWYLERADRAMQKLKRRVEAADAPITMLAHSAGGWLGRVYLMHWGTAGVDRYVSLGSPHMPPPRDAPGVVDQTRGLLTACNEACPGAYHSSISYVTIAGKFLHGAPLVGPPTAATAVHTTTPPTPPAAAAAAASATPAVAAAAAAAAGAATNPRSAADLVAALRRVAAAAGRGGRGGGYEGVGRAQGQGQAQEQQKVPLLARLAGAGYQQVCGHPEVWGDFIVPQPSAHLHGATQVDLEGVFHSPLGERLPFFGPWYGSEQVLDLWFHHLTGEDEEKEQQLLRQELQRMQGPDGAAVIIPANGSSAVNEVLMSAGRGAMAGAIKH